MDKIEICLIFSVWPLLEMFAFSLNHCFSFAIFCIDCAGERKLNSSVYCRAE